MSNLLLPSFIDKPPASVSKANGQLADAVDKTKTTAAAIRQARADLGTARRQDKPPAEIRKLEHALEDARHRERQARREVQKANDRLAGEIHRHRDSLIDGIDIDQRHERVQHLLARVAAEIQELEQEVGAVRTVTHVTEERVRNRGFDAVRSFAHRSETPQAHLAELRSDARELYDLGVQLRDTITEPEQPKVAA